MSWPAKVTKCFPTLDYILVTHRDKADDAFHYLLQLLTELGLPMKPDKLFPPCSSLTCLGITIDLIHHTLSIEDSKIKAISLAGANFESRPDTSLDLLFLSSSALENVTSILRYINVSILFYLAGMPCNSWRNLP